MTQPLTSRTNRISHFIRERCHAVPGLRVKLRDLWDQFKEEDDFQPWRWTKADFIAALDELGYKHGRGPSNHVYVANLDLRAFRRPYKVQDGKLVQQGPLWTL